MDDNTPYPALAVANYFISLALKKGDSSLNPMKLQKLIYFAHGWYLALTGKPLIEERIEAWKYGPVVSLIYHKFKSKGCKPIQKFAEIYSPIDFDDDFSSVEGEIPIVKNDPTVEGLLDKIWEVYGKYTAIQLSNATHEPGTPWRQTWEALGNNRTAACIPDTLIKDHFAGLKLAK